MSLARIGARAALAAVGVLISVAVMAAPSWAAGGTKLCIPRTSDTELKTPLPNGTCERGFALSELGAEGKQGPEGKEGKEGKQGPEGKNALSNAELETLQGILPCIKSVSKGIDEKPTVQFHGCNVQIVNGAGKTATTNGEGNLVIGYDEHITVCENPRVRPPCSPGEAEEPVPYTQTGSHNLLLGTGNSFTSYGGVVGGVENEISGQFASVMSGSSNHASGNFASVSTGMSGTASGAYSSVTGGNDNQATGELSSVSGGDSNEASGNTASVSGGSINKAATPLASISGGLGNSTTKNELQWIGGGYLNVAEGQLSSVFGGKELTAKNEYEATP